MKNKLHPASEAALELMRFKSAFLTNIRHELFTPMHGVIGMTEMLLETALDDAQRDYARTIRESADELLTVINDILDMSKIEAGEMCCEIGGFDVREIIESTVEMLEERALRKNIELELIIDRDIPQTLSGDSRRLQQVLTNLVGNAVKFTERGGVRVEVKTEKETARQLTLRFDVIDTGIGIDEKNLKNLFQPFAQIDDSSTRQYGGAGLGLIISKQIVEMMSGEITAQSQPEKGSCFSFTACFDRLLVSENDDDNVAPLPTSLQLAQKHFFSAEDNDPFPVCNCLITQDGAQTELKVRILQTEKSPLRILVVEDNEVNQFVILSQLEKIGIEADVAVDGIEALEKIAAGNYQLIFMDCQMPRLDGYQAAEKIRCLEQLKRERGEEFTPLTIIALTAHTLAGEREKCLAAGMDDFLSKPLKFGELAAFVRFWSDKSAAEEILSLADLAQNSPSVSVMGKDAARPCPPDSPAPVTQVNNLDDTFPPEIIQIYFMEAARQIQEMGRALKKNEVASIVRLAHALRGNSLAVGAFQIAATAATVEEHGLKNNLEEILFYFRKLDSEFASLSETLET